MKIAKAADLPVPSPNDNTHESETVDGAKASESDVPILTLNSKSAIAFDLAKETDNRGSGTDADDNHDSTLSKGPKTHRKKGLVVEVHVKENNPLHETTKQKANANQK